MKPAPPQGELTYTSYLRLPDLLDCQSPQTDHHDELLFVVIHQVYELWFKQILHEAVLLQRRMEDGDAAAALPTTRRIAKILKTIVGQLDVLETMTPRQFAAFRPQLGGSSGRQLRQRLRQGKPCELVPAAQGRDFEVVVCRKLHGRHHILWYVGRHNEAARHMDAWKRGRRRLAAI